MKAINLILTGAFWLTATVFVNAQTISIGARGGATLSNVSEPSLVRNVLGKGDPILSANAGVFAQFQLGEHFAIRPEIGFVQKGFGASLGTDISMGGFNLPIGGSVDLRVTHLQMPILAQYSFGSGPVKGYVVAGPALGYATKATLVTRPELIIQLRPIRTDVSLNTLQYNRFEISGMAGLGLSFDTGFGHVFVEGRYEQGLTRTYNVPLVRVNAYNQNVSLIAGFAIPLN